MTKTDSIKPRNQLVRQQQHNNSSSIQQVDMNPEPIDFDECLKDSPKFRQVLKDNLTYVENLESCMAKAIKQLNNYIETGREHIKSHQDLIGSMKVLNSSLGPDNETISTHGNTLLGILDQVMKNYAIIIDQSARTVGTSLNKFINDVVFKIHEARKSFDKISHEYDQALTRHSQPVKKQQDDSENLLIATSTAFTHTSLDLSIQLTCLQAKKGYDILCPLLSFTKAHGTFFHQGYDLFEDLKPHISDMDEYLTTTQDEFETLTRSLPSKHLLVNNNELKPPTWQQPADATKPPHLEGYLFKRGSNFKVWNRRFFMLKEYQLVYQKRGETTTTIMEPDLRLLTVRPVERAEGDRRFCFEVLSPQKSHILQADTEAACNTWITAIQSGINAAYHDTEYKAIPKSLSANEMASSGSSSWGSGFSLKALQQQATSRLNSITTSSESKHNSSKQAQYSTNSKWQQGDNKQHKSTSSNNESGEDEDQDFKVDEQGRSYAPLRDNDDADYNGDDDGFNANSSTTTYPVAAGELKALQNIPPKPIRAFMQILALPGNETCADCGSTQVNWASINLGITLCIECAGIHRSLGVHLSKVRSLTLDTEVWSPEIVQLMLSLGNTNVNSAKLACYRGQMAPIDADSCREDREKWIKAKYLLKSFTKPPSHDDGTTSLGDDSLVTSTVESVIGQESGPMANDKTDKAVELNDVKVGIDNCKT